MKGILTYLGSIVILVAAICIAALYFTDNGNNKNYIILLSTMAIGIVLQVVLGFVINNDENNT